MTNATLRGTSDAGNPRVRFDEGLRVRRNARRGATYLEYALLAALVAIVVAAAAMIFGDDIKELFKSTGDQTVKVNEQVKQVDLTKGFDNGGKKD